MVQCKGHGEVSGRLQGVTCAGLEDSKTQLEATRTPSRGATLAPGQQTSQGQLWEHTGTMAALEVHSDDREHKRLCHSGQTLKASSCCAWLRESDREARSVSQPEQSPRALLASATGLLWARAPGLGKANRQPTLPSIQSLPMKPHPSQQRSEHRRGPGPGAWLSRGAAEQGVF